MGQLPLPGQVADAKAATQQTTQEQHKKCRPVQATLVSRQLSLNVSTCACTLNSIEREGTFRSLLLSVPFLSVRGLCRRWRGARGTGRELFSVMSCANETSGWIGVPWGGGGVSVSRHGPLVWAGPIPSVLEAHSWGLCMWRGWWCDVASCDVASCNVVLCRVVWCRRSFQRTAIVAFTIMTLKNGLNFLPLLCY